MMMQNFSEFKDLNQVEQVVLEGCILKNVTGEFLFEEAPSIKAEVQADPDVRLGF